MKFKEDFKYKYRKLESTKILLKYPSRIPIIVEKYKDSQLKDIDKNKYLVPKDLYLNQFIYVIRKRIKLSPSESLFIMINNELCPSNMILSEIYDKYVDEDGFLYITYTSENTFG